MNKLLHFIAKHKFLSFFVLVTFVCGVYSFLLLMFDASIWVLLFVNLILVFIIYAYVEYSSDPIMRKALKELNDNCNPYPLLEETEKLLTYKNSEMQQQIILINHAVGLRAIGEYQRNLETLQTLNIDKVAGMPPINKVVYYNNLMDACELMEKYEEADVWYSKMMLIHADIKNQKQLKMLEQAILGAKAFRYYREEEYDKALLILHEMKSSDKRGAIEDALLYAKIAIAMNDVETAKDKLQFVIENGNRLYAVTEAKEWLEELTV